MQLVLPPLPYAFDALEPHISRTTLEVHHGKHHRTYVENTKALAKRLHMNDLPLEDIIRRAATPEGDRALFNNAAQAWNHAFYWRSLRPGGGPPRGAIAALIERDLGGYAAFLERFAAAASGHFGSGWAWLVLRNGRLAITTTENAGTPLVAGHTPLLTLDVWEHAYYLDYQNRRPVYVAAVVEQLLNWDFAVRNLTRHGAAITSLLGQEPVAEGAS
jgi:Fe-Mn family superoxide dismutase